MSKTEGQSIKYGGPKYGTVFYGKYVRDEWLPKAHKWVLSQPFSRFLHPETNGEYRTIEFSRDCLKVLGTPLKFETTNKTDGPACSTFSASGYKKNESPPPPWKPQSSSTTIKVCKWLASMAWVRAGIMHELIENYIMIGYHRYKEPYCTSQKQVNAHKMTCNIVEKYTFEDLNSEKPVRMANKKHCEDDLNRIIEKLTLPSLISPPVAVLNLIVLRGIRNVIQNQGYIPGYCEVYEDFGYERKELSSIAYIFEAAKKAKIKLVR